MEQTIARLKRLFLEEWKTLLMVNVLFTIASLPILTVGPALLAMNGVLTRVADDRSGCACWAEFWNVFKAKFWRGIQLEVIGGAYLFTVLWSGAVAQRLDTAGQTAMWLCLSLSVFLAAMVSVYLVPLLADSDLPFFRCLWNGVLLSFVRLPRTLLAMAAVYGLLYLFVLLYPVSVLPYAMLVLAVAAAISTAVVWPAVNALIFKAL